VEKELKTKDKEITKLKVILPKVVVKWFTILIQKYMQHFSYSHIFFYVHGKFLICEQTSSLAFDILIVYIYNVLCKKVLF